MKSLLTFAVLAAGAAHAATDADIARCRAIVDNGARLACYDALLPSQAAPPAPPPPPARPAAAVAAPAAAAVVAPPAAAVAAPAAAPAPDNRFGFEARVWQEAPESIESRILGRFDGWEPKSRFRLENGQVWQVSDDSRGVMSAQDPKVKITRGTFGTFFLEIEGKRQAPRVKRVE